MKRISVAPDLYFGQFCYSLNSTGALLVSLDVNGRPNPMTIGWAQLGCIWGKWILSVLVRPSRYTYECCNLTGDFTVCIPYLEDDENALFCGTKSGRDFDKIAQCGYTISPAMTPEIKSPWIDQCGLVYEARTVLYNEVTPQTLAPEILQGAYPQGDLHRIFFGEVLSVHADEDFAQRYVMS